MATGVIMPRQGQSVESCIITKWNVKKGDSVKEGDVLFEYETDKAAFEEEAKVNGTVLEILAEEGDDVPCLDTVCVIGNEGDDISEFLSASSGIEEEAEVKNEAGEAKEEVVIVSTKKGDEEKVSPRAKMMAEEKNLDLSKAVPTGPDGRIIERDVLTLAKNGFKIVKGEDNKEVCDAVDVNVANNAEIAEYEDIKHSNVRKVIAKSMHASLTNMAQLTFNRSFDATEMMSYRKTLKKSSEAMGLVNITINDIIMYAVSRTLLQHKSFNAHYDDEKLRVFNNVNLGMAVDTPRGLLVPTIFNANKMSLNEISIRAKELGSMAGEGKISPDLLTGASFTVSNLGSFGIESFTPIVNPPQTGILGVCGLTDKVKVVEGNIVPYKSMNLSFTCDHRAVDGADAARLLKDLCENLENFSALLAK
ncbi:2-oxo acid dehydrogenase acyltransferase (catalytic domain) [Anaerofustis stercorihominis DSM 17244]|uniref:Dihydrolipoamide acetyltransferase component of pyruvate dehydrogenase complex n=1 Tax=Anaerofustis stercorihominis DSM 17244 TaxID=445971 RepID=B1CB02_9FIRM|nr:dihydrolipoamide acetyltransferase family protein [Anaerofustis stercorihominis]EDS71449.1 2-oxo acid dehydrogenase acyltransferase (catalytic domain) [Anaerofustis stercorihominis DSM 17244]